MIIQMTLPMSGTRPGGERWPAPFTDFEVAPWEGKHLIGAGMAVEVPDRTPPSEQPGFGQGASDPQPDEPPAQPDGFPPGEPELKLPEPDLSAPAPDPAREPVPQPAPQPADPKQAWVDYAISKGTPPDMANAWTKQRLMAEFGGRL
jgi:hypothetical protein